MQILITEHHNHTCLQLPNFHGQSVLVELEKKRNEKTTPFGVKLVRSQVLYRAAQSLFQLRYAYACSICESIDNTNFAPK